jgi:hypothetical protein
MFNVLLMNILCPLPGLLAPECILCGSFIFRGCSIPSFPFHFCHSALDAESSVRYVLDSRLRGNDSIFVGFFY